MFFAWSECESIIHFFCFLWKKRLKEWRENLELEVLSETQMSQTKKLTPNLDQQSTKVLNLTVLQRIDPFIDEILFTAAHVSFYDFNIETNQWVRSSLLFSFFFFFLFFFTSSHFLFSFTTVESQGCRRISLRCQEVSSSTIFSRYSLYALMHAYPPRSFILFFFWFRNSQPRFQFIVMNRRSTGSDLFENLIIIVVVISITIIWENSLTRRTKKGLGVRFKWANYCCK